MREKPILFSGEMVKAILSGAKTQTRRLVNWKQVTKATGCTKGRMAYSTAFKSWAVFDGDGEADLHLFDAPYEDGMRLWVKESHWHRKSDGIRFFDNGDFKCHPESFIGSETLTPTKPLPNYSKEDWKKNGFKRVPSIHMWRWASRITLEIVSVRVERLNEISHRDALAEGVEYDVSKQGGAPRPRYEKLWESINGKGSWAKNPWVWAITFKRI